MDNGSGESCESEWRLRGSGRGGGRCHSISHLPRVFLHLGPNFSLPLHLSISLPSLILFPHFPSFKFLLPFTLTYFHFFSFNNFFSSIGLIRQLLKLLSFQKSSKSPSNNSIHLCLYYSVTLLPLDSTYVLVS